MGLRKTGVKLTRFGWHGLKGWIPAGWQVKVEGGNSRKGYLRFDETTPRLEVRWERFKRDKAPDLEKILKNLEKKIKKKDSSAKTARKGEAKIRGHRAIYAYRRGVEDSYVYVFNCDRTMRTFILNFHFYRDEFDRMKKYIEAVISRLDCHPEGDSRLWNILDFTIVTPKDFELIDRQFYPADIYLLFESERGYIGYERVGLASRVLRKRSLEDWVRKEYRRRLGKTLKGLIWKASTHTKTFGHEGLEYPVFYRRGIFKRSMEGVTLSWVCEETDRIYCLTVLGVKGLDGGYVELFKRISESIRCHRS